MVVGTLFASQMHVQFVHGPNDPLNLHLYTYSMIQLTECNAIAIVMQIGCYKVTLCKREHGYIMAICLHFYI